MAERFTVGPTIHLDVDALFPPTICERLARWWRGKAPVEKGADQVCRVTKVGRDGDGWTITLDGSLNSRGAQSALPRRPAGGAPS